MRSFSIFLQEQMQEQNMLFCFILQKNCQKKIDRHGGKQMFSCFGPWGCDFYKHSGLSCMVCDLKLWFYSSTASAVKIQTNTQHEHSYFKHVQMAWQAHDDMQ